VPAPDYADEYASCRSRFREILDGCTDELAATVIPTCPDWNVRDLCAHNAGIAAALVARDNPGSEGQGWVDRLIAARAHLSVREILDEWDTVGPAFEDLMRKHPRAFGGLVYDAVAHEHDLRGAIDRPGARESDGVWASLEVMMGIVTGDLAAKGPVPGTMVLAAGDRQWTVGEGGPTVSLTTTPFELMRLLGSRRSRAQLLAAPWQGDVTPFIEALVHMPLPEADIVE